MRQHGCDVAITSRKAEHLDPTVGELRGIGVRALAAAADVRDPAAVDDDVVSAVVGELGRLDILVNGAAGNFVCLAENLSPNGFGTVVDIDLKGTFNVSRAALPHLKERGGSVINISATLPYLGTMGQSHAAAAKAGIDSLTRTLAVRVGTARHSRERHRAGSDRRHRRRASPDQRSVARARRCKCPLGRHGDHRRHRARGAVSLLGRRLVRQRRDAGRRWRALAAIGADSRRECMTRAPVPAWAAGVCEGVHAAGSRHVVYVPDNPLSHVLRDVRGAVSAMSA